MSALLGEATSFLDRYIISYGVGTAAGAALAPYAQSLANEAWTLSGNDVVPPPAVLLAEGVAQGQVSKEAAYAWAKQTGFGTEQMDALVSIANVGPGLGYAFEAWRRGFLSDTEFQTALNRTGLEPQWYTAMKALKDELLEGAEIAKAVHRGIMKGDGLLIAEPPTAPGNVPAVPPSDIDPLKEAAGSGITAERLRIMVGNAGLPLGLHEMLSLLNRGAMTKDDVQRGIAESNLRNEYQDVALLLARQLLTPHEYAELFIRGWIDKQAMYAGGQLHGMEQADMDLLADVIGRPIVVHQVTTALARGGTFGGDYAGVPEPYLTALRQSNVRPEWGNLAYANRYTLPGYFVIKAMLADGTLTVDEATVIFEQEGWPPDLAAKAAKALGGTGAAKANTWVTRAQGYLFTALHKAYQDTPEYIAKARAAMTEIGISTANQDEILALFKTDSGL